MKSILEYTDDFHNSYQQVAKRIRASEIKKRNVKINRPAQTASIQGSSFEPYQVTLSSCTCADFGYMQQPCKHMYRLAVDLGLLPELPLFNKDSEYEFVTKEQQIWKQAYLDGKISAERYVKAEKAMEIKGMPKTQKSAGDEKLLICLSGTPEEIDYWDYLKMLIAAGFSVSTSVSKKTTYLVVGREADQAKIDKAKLLQVPILSYGEFEEKVYKPVAEVASCE